MEMALKMPPPYYPGAEGTWPLMIRFSTYSPGRKYDRFLKRRAGTDMTYKCIANLTDRITGFILTKGSLIW